MPYMVMRPSATRADILWDLVGAARAPAHTTSRKLASWADVTTGGEEVEGWPWPEHKVRVGSEEAASDDEFEADRVGRGATRTSNSSTLGFVSLDQMLG